MYCNNLNSLLNTCKVSYYNQQFDVSKREMKRTWSIISSAIKPEKKNYFKAKPQSESITYTTKIAAALNIHFQGLELS